MVRRLEQLHVVVVRARIHWRTGVETEDAALGNPTIRPGIGGMIASIRASCFGEPLRRRPHRRNATIRRIDDQRRPPVLGHAGPIVEPELVVGAGVGIAAFSELNPSLGGLGHHRGRFFIREDVLPGELGRTFERRRRAEVPDTLKIGRTPGGLRRGFRLRGLCGCRKRRHEREGQHPECNGENSTAHVPLLAGVQTCATCYRDCAASRSSARAPARMPGIA